jgi:putative redox protein
MERQLYLIKNHMTRCGFINERIGMKAKVVWKKKMSFEGSADSGFSLPLGTVPEVGGDNDGFQPMELLAIGLAGCTAMDVISILTKKRQDVTTFEVQVRAARADDHPKVFTHLEVEYIISGNELSQEAVSRAVELSSEKYCPAQSMFKQIVPMDIKITIKG